MKPRYALSIPKPCHENWSDMTPNVKGRFCQSCSKTVVDFTAMSTSEVQEFIHFNKNQRICGHIKKSQLDTINLKIYDTVFEQRMPFHKLFLVALLLAMGTSLLSCSDEKGQTKKIDSVEIIEQAIDSTKTRVEQAIDSSANSTSTKKTDSLIVKTSKTPTIPVMGDIVMVEGIMIVEEVNPNQPMSWHSVDEKPNFIDAPKDLSGKDIKTYFTDRLHDFVIANFKVPQGDLGLKGRQRINTQFTIDKNGQVSAIKVRAPHQQFEKEAKRVISLLPQFSPAKYNDQHVALTYNLPITFVIEE
ncbi:energy transducer TonB [uncultured Psychroserpens sp.]|uniref:energy transducer TonB n=1 Tax=uncultured Psychroserpens sp. TaxID=255436 RepID=UPI002627C95B|nr:energy transducer TonB [uncultured Psychroserpens sp.]